MTSKLPLICKTEFIGLTWGTELDASGSLPETQSLLIDDRRLEASITCSWVSLVAQTVENLPTIRETQVQSLGWEDPLEKEMATYSSILAWRIPCIWTKEPGRQSMGSQRARHYWVTNTHIIRSWHRNSKLPSGKGSEEWSPALPAISRLSNLSLCVWFFFFFATLLVGSWFPNQGSNSCPPAMKAQDC